MRASRCDREQNDSFLNGLYINGIGTIYNEGFHSQEVHWRFLLPMQNYGVSKEIVIYCSNIRSFNIGSFAYSKVDSSLGLNFVQG